MTDEQKKELLKLKEQAQDAIDYVRIQINYAKKVTFESDMTADFIWGNCTLEELEKHLESVKADPSLAINLF